MNFCHLFLRSLVLTESQKKVLNPIFRTGDLVLLITLSGSIFAAFIIGWYFDNLSTMFIVGAPILILGILVFLLFRGKWQAWSVLAFCNVAAVALHIQLAEGQIAYHFGVFGVLAMLMVYRDYRPVLFAALLFAVHHIGFNQLQEMGYGIILMPMPGLTMVLIHCLYVVVQAGVEIVLARQLGLAALDAAELEEIIYHIDQGQKLQLDLSGVTSTRPISNLLQQTVNKIEAAMVDVNQASYLLNESSSNIATSNQDLNQRSLQQLDDMQEVGKSIEQVTSAVHNTAQAATESDKLSQTAVQTAQSGNTAIQDVRELMQTIANSTERIQELTGEIDKISLQTNLLALNAAVEASRAGEHGKGFSVVASEVRTLAQRSAAAANEIKELVSENVGQARKGLELSRSTGGQINDIAQQAQRIRDLLSEMSAAAGQQAKWLDDINETMQRVTEVSQHNTEQAKDTSKAIENVDDLSNDLQSIVNRFVLASGPQLKSNKFPKLSN